MDHSAHTGIAPSLLDICTQAGMSTTLIVIAAIFSTMSIFYTVRLFFPKVISACCGFFSYWNESAHILCGIGMVAMVIPTPKPVTNVIFAILFALVALGYAIYLTRDDGPSRFWKTLHIAIYLGMSYMFLMPLIQTRALDYLFIGVYGFAFLFFAKWTLLGIIADEFHFLAWGADVFHLLMSGTMALMFLFPATFMLGHAHHH